MIDDDKAALCKLRLSKAEEFLDDAQFALHWQRYSSAANRSYYAIFHSVRALFALEGKEFKKHSGLISYFQRDYVKTNIFDKSLSSIISNAFTMRQECDYNDDFTVLPADVERQVEEAEIFLNTIKLYIELQLKK